MRGTRRGCRGGVALMMMRRSALEEVVDGLEPSATAHGESSRAGVVVERDRTLVGVSVSSFSSGGEAGIRSRDARRDMTWALRARLPRGLGVSKAEVSLSSTYDGPLDCGGREGVDKMLDWSPCVASL